MLYFSDCQAGAAAGCTPGNNANAGTSAGAPKRDLSGIALSNLSAGTQLLFARGGSWTLSSTLRTENANVTAAAPLVFDAYGSGATPVLRIASGNLFEFGRYQSTLSDGGYRIRNLRLDGMGTAQWGIFVGDHVHDMTIENVEISGFGIGIHTQSVALPGVTRFALRNSNISRNRQMGMLGKVHDSVIEGNLFEANNFSGSSFNHAIYLSGGNNVTVRNNRMVRNSSVNGTCQGGNFTIHGQVDGLLVEGNLIEQDSAGGGCYGFSLTPGYSDAEWFRNSIVRSNTVVNVGFCAVCVGSAPGIVVEANKLINLQATYQIGVQIPVGDRGAGDVADGGAIVRNNVVCQASASGGSSAVQVANAAEVTGNVLRTGTDATTGACAR